MVSVGSEALPSCLCAQNPQSFFPVSLGETQFEDEKKSFIEARVFFCFVFICVLRVCVSPLHHVHVCKCLQKLQTFMSYREC